MMLKLARDQRSSIIGNVSFMLDARAELTPDEQEAVRKYKLGKTLLYSKGRWQDPGGGLFRLLKAVLAFKMMNIRVTINDLVGGKHLECKDIVEMIAVEEQIKEACETFKAVLETARHFGGEELVEL